LIESHTEEKSMSSWEKAVSREDIAEIGEVPLTLSADEPYWRICNENGSWGIGIRGIGIPEVIYQLLPDRVYGLKGINYSGIQTEENSKEYGNYKNKIVLLQRTPVEERQSIPLTGLQLPKDIISQITADRVSQSKLEIMANYTFMIKVPYGNTSREFINCKENPLWIKGKVTIRYGVDVIHDIPID
jgi:hypothetical protein